MGPKPQSLTHEQLEMDLWSLIIIASDVLVIKHFFGIRNADYIVMVMDHLHAEMLVLQGTTFEDITFCSVPKKNKIQQRIIARVR